METMNCQQIESQLDAYLDAELDAESIAGIDRHIADCDDCAGLMQTARSLRDALASLPVAGPSPEFFDRALQTAMAEQQAAKLPARHRVLGAIAASVAVITLASFLVHDIDDPQVPTGAGVAQVAMAVEETRTINLVFAAADNLDDVSLTVALPAGIELASYPGQQEIRWTTRMQSGNNILPLELVALSGSGGEIVATLRQNGKEKIFRVNIAVVSG
jgi:predicted anti-sigma-YlaC factor YlaD